MNSAWECVDWIADTRVPESVMPLETRDDFMGALHCAVRHLAVAATELARAEGLPRDAVERFAAAEALFRAQSAHLWGVSPQPVVAGPSVRLSNEETVPLTVLFADICRYERSWLPHRSIDPELVHGAKEILRGLAWDLPGKAQGSGA